jgi:hypothetical protein
MLQERLNAIKEELLEVEHLPELKAMWANWQAEAEEVANDALCQLMLRSTLCRLRLFVEQRAPEEMAPPATQQPTTKPLAARGPSSRKYVLLKKEVNWSQTPQVKSIMAVIGAHAEVGETLDEEWILQMLEENRHVLKTRQPVKKVFKYYAGNWDGGLEAHGNIRKVTA